jgi:hypothetical protein
LYFPENTFPAQQYSHEFELKVCKSDDAAHCNTTNVFVDVILHDIVAIIKGGNRTVPDNENIILDGSDSYDIDGSTDPEVFNWECKKEDGSTCGLTLTSTKVVTISKNALGPGTYFFTLTYTKGSRSSTITSKIIVQEKRINVYIQISRMIVPGNTKIFFTAKVDSYIPLDYMWYVWENGVPKDINPISCSNTNRFRLCIKEKSFAPGAHLIVKVEVYKASDKSYFGDSSVSLTLNSPPKAGTLTVNPTGGVQCTTNFQLTASGFTDDGPVISYSYGYISNGKRIFVVSQQRNLNAEFPIPISGTVNVFVVAIDEYGEETYVESNVLILDLPNNFDLYKYVGDSCDALNTNDLDLTLGSLQCLGNLMKNDGTTRTDQVKAKRLELYEKMLLKLKNSYNSFFGKTRINFLQQATTLYEIVSSYEDMSVSSDEHATSYLSKLCSDIDNNADDDTISYIVKSFSNIHSSLYNKPLPEHQRLLIIKDLDDTLTPFATSLINRMSFGSNKIYESDGIRIINSRQSMQDISNLIIKNSNVGITVPDGLLNGLSNPELLNIQNNGIDFSIVSNKWNKYVNYESSENITADVVSVNVFVNGQKLNVKGLSNSIDITLSGSFAINVENIKNLDYVCKYWDTTELEWRTNGCKISSHTATSCVCSCDHTTDFSVFLNYVKPNLNILTTEDLNIVGKLNTDNYTTMIVVFVLGLIYCMLMVFFEGISCLIQPCILSREKKRKIKEMNIKYLNKDIQNKGIIRPLVDKFKAAHIWLSLLFIPKSEQHFTRSKRLTILYMIILGTMASNALTFGQKQQNEVQMIASIILSDVLITPAIVLFTFLFIKTRSRYIHKGNYIFCFEKSTKKN